MDQNSTCWNQLTIRFEDCKRNVQGKNTNTHSHQEREEIIYCSKWWCQIMTSINMFQLVHFSFRDEGGVKYDRNVNQTDKFLVKIFFKNKLQRFLWWLKMKIWTKESEIELVMKAWKKNHNPITEEMMCHCLLHLEAKRRHQFIQLHPFNSKSKSSFFVHGATCWCHKHRWKLLKR